MRFYVAFLVLVFCLEPAFALPVPPPPDDYLPDQYIDGRGCVFNREDHDWKKRVDSKGRQVCGFPSSLSARRTDPDTISILADEVAQPVMHDPEMELTRQLAAGLRQGEFVADERKPEKLKDFPASDGGLGAQIEGQIRLQTAMQTAFADDMGNTELCRDLGYHISDEIKPILGLDVMQGLCPGMVASEPSLKISHPAPDAGGGRETNDSINVAMPSVAPDISKPDAKASPRPENRPHRRVARKKTVKPASPEGDAVETIPASARYVGAGTYTANNAAATAKRQIASLGYPMASSQQVTEKGVYLQLFAGPFDDRRSLVVALKLLRDNGFPSAYAR